jgi:3-oxoacyl-[acyl-carrier-protein] synthase II
MSAERREPKAGVPRRPRGGRRVVVTGLGCISPVGLDAASSFGRLLEGRSGVRPISHFDASTFDCRIAGEVDGFDPANYGIGVKDARRMDTFVQFACAAAKMALDDAGIDLSGAPHDRIGVSIGTGVGGLQVIEKQQERLLKRGPRAVSPFLIPMMLGNLASGHVAIRHGLRGPNLHVSTACATGTQAIADAGATIERGDADVMLAGGAEAAITPLLVSGFSAAGALCTSNADPAGASRPFDRSRTGFVMGEGAGVLVLEDEEFARRRGAAILAELTGYGVSSDAHHVTAPEERGHGAQLAMRMALARAELASEQIDYVNAHGTGTVLGDISEARAVKQVFKEHATSGGLWLSATKSMTGHLLGAAGAVEAVICVQSIRHGKVHPTINLNDPDPECDLDFVPKEARDRRLQAVMSNSFGFGGTNATLIFQAY